MKFIVIVFIFFISAFQVKADKPLVLSKTLAPLSMKIHGDCLYVTEKESLQLYSIKERRFVRFIGKFGQGPGEFAAPPLVYRLTDDKILVESFFKMAIHKADGEYVSERKCPIRSRFVVPFGDQYLIKKQRYFVGKKKNTIHYIYLYEKNFKLRKVLSEIIKDNVLVKLNAFPYEIDCRVYKNYVYIPRPEQGFVFNVFDKKGELIRTLKSDYKKIRVTDSMIKKKKDNLKKDLKEHWPKVKQTLYFPDYLPSFKQFDISGDTIYLKTWERQGDESMFVLLDLEGKIKQTITLPDAANLANEFSSDLYVVLNGTYYYILGNPDTEEWELHSTDLKRYRKHR